MNRIYAHGVILNSLAFGEGYLVGQPEPQGLVIKVTAREVTVDWGHYRKIYHWQYRKGQRPGQWQELSAMGGLYKSPVKFVPDRLTMFALGLSQQAAV